MPSTCLRVIAHRLCDVHTMLKFQLSDREMVHTFVIQDFGYRYSSLLLKYLILRGMSESLDTTPNAIGTKKSTAIKSPDNAFGPVHDVSVSGNQYSEENDARANDITVIGDVGKHEDDVSTLAPPGTCFLIDVVGRVEQTIPSSRC